MGKISTILERLGRGLGEGLRRIPPAAILVLALACGLCLRIAVATTQHLDEHEVHYLADARAVEQLGLEAMRGSVHGWLPALANAALLRTSADIGALELRYLQTAWSMVALLGVYGLGRLAGNARIGAIAALILALSPEAIWFGGSLQPYSSHLALGMAMLGVHVATLRGGRAPARALGLATIAALAVYHHPVSLVYVGALLLHCAVAPVAPDRRAWAAGALVLAALLSLPGWVGGDPGKAQDLLHQTLPDFLGRPLIMGVVFLALWDVSVKHLEGVFHSALPLFFLVPLIAFMPYFRESYVIPGTAPWAWVLACALVDGGRPRLVALCALHFAVADLGLLLQASSGPGP